MNRDEEGPPPRWTSYIDFWAEDCEFLDASIRAGKPPPADLGAFVSAALQLCGENLLSKSTGGAQPSRALIRLVRFCLRKGISIGAAEGKNYIAAYWNKEGPEERGLAVSAEHLDEYDRAAWIEAAVGPLSARELAKRLFIDHKTVARWKKHFGWQNLVQSNREFLKTPTLSFPGSAENSDDGEETQPDDSQGI